MIYGREMLFVLIPVTLAYEALIHQHGQHTGVSVTQEHRPLDVSFCLAVLMCSFVKSSPSLSSCLTPFYLSNIPHPLSHPTDFQLTALPHVVTWELPHVP